MLSDSKKRDAVSTYIEEVQAQLDSGHAKEHAYRPALERLISTFENVTAVNDPRRSQYGNPDFIFLKTSNKHIILGYAEAKDVTVELDQAEKSEQLQRYAGYNNLFLTNYLDFRFFRNGEKYQDITIGSIQDTRIIVNSDQLERLERELKEFLSKPPESMRSGKRLAEIMGAKARRVRDNVAAYLKIEGEERNEELEKIYKMMRELLVHDLTVEKFADMYAQTLIYGLFIARYGDKTRETFTREEARELIPTTNPFLREFFDHIAGPRFDTRLKYIVDELCEVFSVSNVQTLVQKHLKLFEFKDEKDPIIHFYEDFLKEYDPSERKKMGAYYTPLPVVRFIIRNVDKILREEFGLQKGLADTTKIPFVVRSQGTKAKVDLHRVQILDPAVGTATFLNEIIKEIHSNEFEGQGGRWPSYVESDLLPRLYGFELMMAPYTIAHLKLGMTLQETGATGSRQRLGVYLTNTLEEGDSKEQELFHAFGLAEVVAQEAKNAAKIKHEKPIMIVVGNPPYSGVSSNETKYANNLITKYKVEPGGQAPLRERKHWLNDDYVKFIAFAEDMIIKNGTGVVAMITNHGYLDNPTFRGMRWHLTQSFDKIFILDLHGNSKKQEIAPDGGKDENVFNIQQGVAIILGVKTGENKKGKSAKVFHAELFGKRQNKFDALENEMPYWQEVHINKNTYDFVNRNIKGLAEYEKGIRVDELFRKSVTGIVTMGDSFVISDTKEEMRDRIQKLIDGYYDESTLNNEFKLGKNYAKWIIQNSSSFQFDESKLVKINYRPFDNRWTYFDNKVIWRWRENIMKHFLKENTGIMICRQQKQGKFAHVFVENLIGESSYISNRTSEIGYSVPLYLYSTDGERVLNLNTDIHKKIEKVVGDISPEDILNYVYAVLHSPSYREKYNEFLKTDFPRVPHPSSREQFVELSKLGDRLRKLHLLEELPGSISIGYPEMGSNKIEKVSYIHVYDLKSKSPVPTEETMGRVYINESQFFTNISETAWNFYIGGYQPAQKWLKDRKGRLLTNEDIEHYQKIIVALVETDRSMREIDKII